MPLARFQAEGTWCRAQWTRAVQPMVVRVGEGRAAPARSCAPQHHALVAWPSWPGTFSCGLMGRFIRGEVGTHGPIAIQSPISDHLGLLEVILDLSSTF